MKKPSKLPENVLERKLDTTIGLLRHLLRELAREGVPEQAIAKHFSHCDATIFGMLKGSTARWPTATTMMLARKRFRAS